MNDYNFWKDLLGTFQSSADWIKALIVLMPPGFLLGVIALILFHKRAGQGLEQVGKEPEPRFEGDNVRTYRDRFGLLHIGLPHWHIIYDPKDESPLFPGHKQHWSRLDLPPANDEGEG